MKDQTKHIANQRKQLKQQAAAIRELKDKNAGLLSSLLYAKNEFKHEMQIASKLRQDVFFYKSLSASALLVSVMIISILVFGV